MSSINDKLFDAIKNGDLEQVKKLLNHPDKRKRANIEARGFLRQTPLIYSIENGTQPITEYLIQQGADVNASDYTGQSPLIATIMMMKQYKKNLNVLRNIRFLIEKGADVKQQNRDGECIMDWIRENESSTVAKYILRAVKKRKIKELKEITVQEIAHMQQTNPKKLKQLLTEDYLLKALKEQPYQQQLDAYLIVKTILPAAKRKELEIAIRANRIKSNTHEGRME